MSGHFEGRVAIVTGGAMGIGKAVAKAFAGAGASVAVVDRDQKEGEKTAAEINALGSARFFPCDVSQPEAVAQMVQSVKQEFGRLDIACNNAGVEGTPEAPTADCSVENWDRVIDINLKGVWLCMKYEIPEMLSGGQGAIVNIASIAGLIGFPGLPAYVASKHGVVGLSRNAALEYATSNIRVNAVCPGGIDTSMLHRVTMQDDEKWREMNEMHPMGRVGKTQEIAAAVLWLCSADASFVTGQALAVDGGYVAR